MKIRHQTQPTHNSCTQTCLAMILGVPVSRVLKHYPEPLRHDKMIEALLECSVPFSQIGTMNALFSGVYTLTVPSINTIGSSHQIILHSKTQHLDRVTVYDPCTGRKGAKALDAVLVMDCVWSNVIQVGVGGRLPRRKAA